MKSSGLRVEHAHATGDGCGLSEEEIAFVAAYIGDGCIHRGQVQFQVSKPRKLTALRAMGPSYEYVAPKAYGPRTKVPLTTFHFDVPDSFVRVFRDGKSMDPAFVHSMNRDDARAFIRAFTTFDGNGDFDRTHLYTSSPALRDDLTLIATFAGYGFSVAEKSSPLSDRPSWEIRIGPNQTARHLRSRHVERRAYSGKMYCVSVPESRIVVRDPNGGAIVTGNCGDFVETCIRLALPSEDIPENPYWARNWLLFGRTCEPVPGAVVVFSRGSGGHVGFVEGRSGDGRYVYTLGGNQANRVSVVKMSTSRVLGYRWPEGYPMSGEDLSEMVGGTLSTNEA